MCLLRPCLFYMEDLNFEILVYFEHSVYNRAKQTKHTESQMQLSRRVDPNFWREQAVCLSRNDWSDEQIAIFNASSLVARSIPGDPWQLKGYLAEATQAIKGILGIPGQATLIRELRSRWVTARQKLMNWHRHGYQHRGSGRCDDEF